MHAGEVVDRNHLLLYAIAFGSLGGLVVLSSSSVIQSIHLSPTNPLFVALLLGAFLIRSFVGIPLSILILFTGFKYPIELAFLIAFTGGIVSAVPPFVVARHVKTPSGIIGIVSKNSEAIVSRIGGLRSIVAARVSVVPSDIVSYGAGLSDVSLRTYLTGTFIGWVPVITILVTMGNSLQSLSFRSTALPTEFLIAGSLLAILLSLSAIFPELSFS
jgi:uncharacterized membrane protein YdjX (TVP38/TMEM64 family)